MIIQADALQIPLESESVDCVVTSPPYFGLRNYGCNGQIGLEKTPEEYIEKMVAVFREVWRVMKPEATLWLNLGDGFSNKQLIGMPWRLALGLQADRWYLRSDIIWAKPNPMPDSVTDRPTKSHEYLFLLTKSPHYFFDQEAVREPNQEASKRRYEYSLDGCYTPGSAYPNEKREKPQQWKLNPGGRNIRTVWTIATQPWSGAHFATFPEKLVEPCIKAGTSEKGYCPACGKPWVRMIGKIGGKWEHRKELGEPMRRGQSNSKGTNWNEEVGRSETKTLGWKPSCTCPCALEDPIPGLVLDPFAGSGTVGVVCSKLNRRFVGLDLKLDYCRMAKKRIYNSDVAML